MEYTYKDWKEGRMEEFYFSLKYVDLLRSGQMKPVEYFKICKELKQIHLFSIEYHLEKKKENFKRRYAQAILPRQFLQDEILLLKNQWHDLPLEKRCIINTEINVFELVAPNQPTGYIPDIKLEREGKLMQFQWGVKTKFLSWLEGFTINELAEEAKAAHEKATYIKPNFDERGQFVEQPCFSTNIGTNLTKDNAKASPHSPEVDKGKQELCFQSFFAEEYKEDLPAMLKQEFKTEIGKDLSLLIYLLKEDQCIILGNRDMEGFLDSMKNYFERYIGSNSGIRDWKKWEEEAYKEDKAKIRIKLNIALNKCKVEQKQKNS